MAAPRTDLEQILATTKSELNDLARAWALVGGLAVAVRAEPRFTRDIDIAVTVQDDPEAERVVRALQGHGHRPVTLIEQEATSRIATMRLIPSRGKGVILDLLFASSGIESEIVEAASMVEVFPDLEVPVATAPHLLALKILSRDDVNRPQDLVDIRALLQVTTAEDLEETRRVLVLIKERGFHRERDLQAALDLLLPET